jgi:CxxC-x17-CxxC domain-containing protein
MTAPCALVATRKNSIPRRSFKNCYHNLMTEHVIADIKKKDVVYFGKCDFRNQNRLFGINRKDRRQHMYVIGKTGTGKSVLLHNMIVQDMVNGEGLCVVDPHGELVEDLMKAIPRSRANDVIYFNPADLDHHIGFNPLELPDPKYKHLVASGLMGIFTKIWANVWSARMEYILNNSILALLDTPGTTLLGVSRLLVDKDYRQRILNNVTDPVIKAFWINEYEEWQDKFRSEAISPIQNKVGQFLSTNLVRNIVGQSKSTIDIFKLMNEGKIFLINVSKGRIGEDNSSLLGAMLITKIQLAAMERVRIPTEERRDFYLYVDEFQNFATDSFAGILSEARKYRLNLILAHQYTGQLITDTSTAVRDAVFGNVGTMITFRVGAKDAEFLEPEYDPEFTIEDIVNLPNYHIYLKLMVNSMTSRPFSALTLPPFHLKHKSVPEAEIIAHTKTQYGRSRKEVEDEIIKWSSGTGFPDEGEADSSPKSSGGKTVISKGKEYHLAVCWNCNKEAKLPFKPQPEKPVYCSDCLEKIREGKIQPQVVPKAASKKKQEVTQSALADIGIEFKPEESISTQNKSPRKEYQQEKKPQAGLKKTDSLDKAISLSQLKPRDKSPKNRERTTPDIDSLRNALQQALNKKDSG